MATYVASAVFQLQMGLLQEVRALQCPHSKDQKGLQLHPSAPGQNLDESTALDRGAPKEDESKARGPREPLLHNIYNKPFD